LVEVSGIDQKLCEVSNTALQTHIQSVPLSPNYDYDSAKISPYDVSEETEHVEKELDSPVTSSLAEEVEILLPQMNIDFTAPITSENSLSFISDEVLAEEVEIPIQSSGTIVLFYLSLCFLSDLCIF
jgi:hypothetical protein